MNALGVVRATEDLDIFLEASEDNADRVLEALHAFGLPPGLPRDALTRAVGEAPTGFGFGRRPLRVDLLTSIQGVDFATCGDSEGEVKRPEATAARARGCRRPARLASEIGR